MILEKCRIGYWSRRVLRVVVNPISRRAWVCMMSPASARFTAGDRRRDTVSYHLRDWNNTLSVYISPIEK